MRLRDLRLAVGGMEHGPGNSIADVPGVHVGHATVETDRVVTGVTAVVTAGPAGRTFVGRYSVDGGDSMTGLGVTEDFGAISAPILFAPSAAVGRVYDGMIQQGLGEDPGLSEDAGWPPIVVPVNDSGLNQPKHTRSAVGEQHVIDALTKADTQVFEGSVGIGAGLTAFGFRSGVGTSSRIAGGYTVGVLIAVNGGEPGRLSCDGWPLRLGTFGLLPHSAPRTFGAVLATNAPLTPRQLHHLAGRGVFGLVRARLLDERSQEGIALAVSTTAIIDSRPDPADGTVTVRHVGDVELPQLFVAAAEACEEAVLNALLQATPLDAKKDPALTPIRQRGLPTLPTVGWPDRIRQMARQHG